jgi:methionyl-tRNA synthetase
MVTGQDADFNEERLITRYNADLANDLGNLVNRTINMSQRYRGGRLTLAENGDYDLRAIRELAASVIDRYRAAFEQFQVQSAIEAVWELVSRANALVEMKTPWKLAKVLAESELLDALLYTLAETTRLLALLLSPVIPAASKQILKQLGAVNVSVLHWGGLPNDHLLAHPSPIFPRIEVQK